MKMRGLFLSILEHIFSNIKIAAVGNKKDEVLCSFNWP